MRVVARCKGCDDLRVIIGVTIFSIGLVADFNILFTRKLHQRNVDFLIIVADTIVDFGGLVQEVVDGNF